MKLKSSIALVMAGVGGTVLFQQIRNGNFKKMFNKMTKAENKMIDDMEKMM